MKIATAAYPLGWFDTWDHYAQKIEQWIADAKENDADLLVFPEYAAMELASLEGTQVAGDIHGSVASVSEKMPDANALHSQLAQKYGVFVLGGSAPVMTENGYVNRAHFFSPSGQIARQDKQIMTRFERDEWDIRGGGPINLFDTPLGKIGVLICYDSEFPLLGRALAEADVILVPSCTEALAGYSRVRIGSMARALEGQCVTAMASLVGIERRFFAVEETVGMGGVFCPPDRGFPSTGVMAEGTLNKSGWTYAEVDLQTIKDVRDDGGVLNRAHWPEQEPRCQSVTYQSFR